MIDVPMTDAQAALMAAIEFNKGKSYTSLSSVIGDAKEFLKWLQLPSS